MQALLYWDYYEMTETVTDLYDKSLKQQSFSRLYDVITSRENILLAYRTIKPNKGSKTPGTDGNTINDSKSDWHCHHKKPYHLSRDDSYSNLTVLHESVHRLIHLKDAGKIKTLVDVLQLNNKQIGKVNELRKQCNNYTI